MAFIYSEERQGGRHTAQRAGGWELNLQLLQEDFLYKLYDIADVKPDISAGFGHGNQGARNHLRFF